LIDMYAGISEHARPICGMVGRAACRGAQHAMEQDVVLDAAASPQIVCGDHVRMRHQFMPIRTADSSAYSPQL